MSSINNIKKVTFTETYEIVYDQITNKDRQKLDKFSKRVWFPNFCKFRVVESSVKRKKLYI